MNLRHRTAGSAVVDGMLGLAALEQKAGNRDSARDIARRSARAVGPDSPGGRESLMAVAAFQGTLPDTAGMLDTYRILIAQDDSDAAALEAYARCATAAGTDLEQASRYALRAVIMSDEDPRMMATLGRAYFKRNLYRKAIRWMDKAVQGAPENLVYRQELVHYRETLKSKPFLYRGRRR
jgi:tetratricopeptide (TPR) repeat protein